jgi:ABC-type glycerol-3-phosphate transport system substrate-binding protein
MNGTRARALALLAVLLTFAFAAACGDDDDSSSSSAAPESSAAPATSAAPETSAAEETSAAAETTAAEETSAPAESSEAPASEEVAVSADGLGSKFDLASAGDITLDLWWLGNLEAPGIEGWMDEMVAAFKTQYPNVTVKPTLYQTDTWIQTQTTACQSKSGPDIWYNWAGTWSLSPAWTGCTVPNEDVLDASDIAANPYAQETLYEGKTWLFPLYRFVYPAVYNKDLVSAAGLDPEAPPTTWEELITWLEAIKKSGVTPWALGLKDGFGGEIIAAGQLEKQWVNAPQDVMQKVIEGDLQFPEWRQWIEKSFEMKPYFNEDANSLGFAEATGLFQTGKAAMLAGGPGVPAAISAMQAEGKNVGVFLMPAFGDGAWAKSVSNTGNGFQVLSSSDQQKAAGAFLAFLQQPENLAKLYEATGNFPASTNWAADDVTNPIDQQLLEWLSADSTSWWIANYTPVDLDVNGTFVMWQKMIAGEIDVDGAMKIYQDALDTWSAANGPALENYQKWVAG